LYLSYAAFFQEETKQHYLVQDEIKKAMEIAKSQTRQEEAPADLSSMRPF
jgi:hypothetical protein